MSKPAPVKKMEKRIVYIFFTFSCGLVDFLLSMSGRVEARFTDCYFFNFLLSFIVTTFHLHYTYIYQLELKLILGTKRKKTFG